MADGQNTEHANWMAQIEAYFEAHPEREYLLREIPVAAVEGVGAAGWIVGAASRAPADPPAFGISGGQKSLHCIIRRSDSAENRPLPGVFLMDCLPPPPPLPKSADMGRVEEALGAQMWQLAQVANALGLSLLTFSRRAIR